MGNQGGFGSAGAGNRSLRRTATAVGVGQTATVSGLRRYTLQARMDEPSVEDLWRSIRTQQCCYCTDNRTFRVLSQHWTRGHGIDLQDIRDRLEVPKNYSFISAETSEIHRARAKRLYNPEKLHNPNDRPRVLSKFGMAAQRAKCEAIPEAGRIRIREKASRASAKASRARVDAYQKTHPCIICGRVYKRKYTGKTTVCSKACNEERRRQKAPHEFPMNRKMKPCKGCGKTIWGNRNTCSGECQYLVRSNHAKSRKGHMANMKAAQAAKWAAYERFCEIDGCENKYRASGMCGPHYQGSRYVSR